MCRSLSVGILSLSLSRPSLSPIDSLVLVTDSECNIRQVVTERERKEEREKGREREKRRERERASRRSGEATVIAGRPVLPTLTLRHQAQTGLKRERGRAKEGGIEGQREGQRERDRERGTEREGQRETEREME